MKLQLTPGHFYLSKDGHVWCCYNVLPDEAEHCQARCVRLSDSSIKYFFIDGRYDLDDKREHCLLKEVSFTGEIDSNPNCNCYLNQIES